MINQPEPSADQAAEIRAAAFKAAALFVRGHSADERYGKASVSTALCAMSDALFRMAAEAQPGTTPAAATPCSVPDPCADGELCDRHETEQAHAEGEHELCGVTCEVKFPSEELRNFVLAKGYPGTKGALDELLRRAASPDVERLRAERDELLAELGGRDDEARERWIQKQLDETGLRSMDFRNGVEMELEPARELLAHWVAAARSMLGDAPNYSETKLSFDVKVAESPELYTLVVQRHGPGVLTPHEARQKAEAALAEALRIVAAWCCEANDVGGVDAGDLAWRLEQAGHPLPDE